MRRVVALAAALSLTVTVTSCSAGGHKPAASGSSSGGSALATRWWDDGSHAAGSTIDPKNPAAAAKKLHPSRQAYCTMLKQTVTAGHSILPDATASSPALVTSTEAFVAELESVAPAEVSGSWKLLGAAVLSLVTSGGKSAASGDATSISAAVASVASDAKARCGLSLAG